MTKKAKPKNVQEFTIRDLGNEFYLRKDEVVFLDSRVDIFLPKGTSVLLVSLPNRFRICTTLFSDTYPYIHIHDIKVYNYNTIIVVTQLQLFFVLCRVRRVPSK